MRDLSGKSARKGWWHDTSYSPDMKDANKIEILSAQTQRSAVACYEKKDADEIAKSNVFKGKKVAITGDASKKTPINKNGLQWLAIHDENYYFKDESLFDKNDIFIINIGFKQYSIKRRNKTLA